MFVFKYLFLAINFCSYTDIDINEYTHIIIKCLLEFYNNNYEDVPKRQRTWRLAILQYFISINRSIEILRFDLESCFVTLSTILITSPPFVQHLHQSFSLKTLDVFIFQVFEYRSVCSKKNNKRYWFSFFIILRLSEIFGLFTCQDQSGNAYSFYAGCLRVHFLEKQIQIIF